MERMQKRIVDHLRCCRAVWFDNHSVDFPYSLRGTGFLVRIGQQDIFVTAKHVLKDFRVSDIRVQFYHRARQFLPLESGFELVAVADDEMGEDWNDLAVFRLSTGHYRDRQFEGQCPFIMNEDTVESDLAPDSNLVVAGFPACRNFINYGPKEITLQANFVGARVLGPSLIDGCTEIRFNQLNELESMDGFSGSPVFTITEDAPPHSIRFAGMMLRSTRRSGVGHMLRPNIVWTALQACVMA
jgi:hypothetical protein